MAMVATQNFRAVDRLLAGPAPEAARILNRMEASEPRFILRHLAGEMNRHYFDTWEQVQLVLGTAVFIILLFFSTAGRWYLAPPLAMIAVVSTMHLWISPQVAELGRAIDFVPRELASAERDRFWELHHLYSGLEVFKMLCGALLAGLLLRSPARKPGQASGPESRIVILPPKWKARKS